MKEKTKRVYKLSAVLMILCLITACVIGTTLAKYTTGGSANDTASVAKWGVKVQVGGTLFGKKYGSATATSGANTIVADSAADVSVSSENKVVGPSTENTVGMKVKLSGIPEVSYTVTSTTNGTDVFLAAGTYAILVEEPGVNAATSLTDLYVKDGDNNYVAATAYSADTTYYRLQNAVELTGDYHPIVWSIDGTAQDSLSAALSALVPNFTGTQAAGTGLDHDKTLTWAWALEHGTTEDEKAKFNNADTILGQLADTATSGTVVKLGTDGKYVAIVTGDYSLEVSVNVSVTVTQVD